MAYIPRQGDIIKLDLNPTKGREQRGRRPGVVVSNAGYNSFTRGLALVCPITNSDKGLPLQPKLDKRTVTTGVVMTDQVKALDLGERAAEFVEQMPADILAEVCDIVSAYSDMDK
jgi:mRNA interferase MazF